MNLSTTLVFTHILEALLVQSSDFITLIFFLNLHPGLQTNMEPKNATFGKGESHWSQGIHFEVPCEFSRVFLNFFFWKIIISTQETLCYQWPEDGPPPKKHNHPKTKPNKKKLDTTYHNFTLHLSFVTSEKTRKNTPKHRADQSCSVATTGTGATAYGCTGAIGESRGARAGGRESRRQAGTGGGESSR